MLKKHMAACLVATAFMTVPVLAQTSTSPGGAQPSTGASSGGSSMSSGSGGASSGAGHFITQQQANQWRGSKLIGVNVYGANNERIGDINEVLVDRQGNADAVVVGVGGFLGIGEKNVALPFSAFEWSNEAPRTASASGTGGTSGSGTSAGGAGGAGGAGTTATTGAGGGAAGTTGSTSSAGGGAGGSGGSGARDRGYPDHAVLRMTKADLENAPTFNYVGETSSGSGSGGAGGGAGRSSGAGAGGGAGAGAGGAGAGAGAGAGGPGGAAR